MKLVIQRVDEAKVTVDEAIIGRISKGLLILVGVSDTDTTDIADKMLDKALKMRIFDDESGKTQSITLRCWRRTASRLPIHLICQL